MLIPTSRLARDVGHRIPNVLVLVRRTVLLLRLGLFAVRGLASLLHLRLFLFWLRALDLTRVFCLLSSWVIGLLTLHPLMSLRVVLLDSLRRLILPPVFPLFIPLVLLKPSG